MDLANENLTGRFWFNFCRKMQRQPPSSNHYLSTMNPNPKLLTTDFTDFTDKEVSYRGPGNQTARELLKRGLRRIVLGIREIRPWYSFCL